MELVMSNTARDFRSYVSLCYSKFNRHGFKMLALLVVIMGYVLSLQPCGNHAIKRHNHLWSLSACAVAQNQQNVPLLTRK